MNGESFAVKDRTCQVRHATEQDLDAIKALILTSSIHVSGKRHSDAQGSAPRGAGGFVRRILRSLLTRNLDWRYFYVAALDDGSLIGCGQAKPRGAILEATSFAIDRGWRNGLVASKLSRYVIAESRLPLWGACPNNIIPFHLRLGARQETDPGRMPGFLRRRMKIFNLICRILGSRKYLAIMVLKETGEKKIRSGTFDPAKPEAR